MHACVCMCMYPSVAGETCLSHQGRVKNILYQYITFYCYRIASANPAINISQWLLTNDSSTKLRLLMANVLEI